MSIRRRIAETVVSGIAGFGAAVALSATAAADPPPDPPAPLPPIVVDPAAPPPPAGPSVPFMGQLTTTNVLAQNGSAPQSPTALGAPALPGLDKTSALAQTAAPALPGAGGPGVVPNMNVFNNSYGIQQNEEPAAPGQGKEFDVEPGHEHDDVSRREWFGRYIDMYRAGMLKGGFLGRVPKESLGQPLPGTDPLPGTNIPSGLGEYLPPPPDVPLGPDGAPLPVPPPDAPPAP